MHGLGELCPGPLVWFRVEGDPEREIPEAGILECGRPECGYVIVTGNFNDAAHADTPILMEGV